MSDLGEKREELQDLLAERESEFLRLYNECKSIVGWPVCGKKPDAEGTGRSDEKLEEDAVEVLERWMLMLDSQVIHWRQVQKVLAKKYKHYEGEKKVVPSKVKRGLPNGTGLEKKRKIEL